MVIDNAELLLQSGDVKEIWGCAITEVVLEMYELQKKEEVLMRNDPLSVLAMNTKANKKELKSLFGDKVVEQLSQVNQKETAGQPAKLKGSDPAWQGKGDKPYFKLLSSHLTSDGLALQKDLEEREKRERESADGQACPQCSSRWTYRGILAGFDISKAEVWGSKDAAETYTLNCKECGHISTVRST